MPKYRSKFASWIGFILSLIFHSSLFAAAVFAFKNDGSANGYAADTISTNISMEMLMATVAEEPASSPPNPEPAPESISKEAVADPTIKPVPLKPEKPKEPEKKKEKPREKPKPIPKQKPKPAVEQPHAVKAEKTIISNDSVNSKATTTGNVTSKNPNLTGSGSSSDEIKAYQSALRREIEQHKKYSQRAKMMRKQGIVRVAFNVGNDGTISGVRVTSSSGSEDLDKSALNAVQSARSVGPRPSGMNSTQTVPISFTIQ